MTLVTTSAKLHYDNDLGIVDDWICVTTDSTTGAGCTCKVVCGPKHHKTVCLMHSQKLQLLFVDSSGKSIRQAFWVGELVVWSIN